MRVYPPAGDQLSWSVPSKLRDECEEARRCFVAKAYTATAVMVRRVLEGLCLDQGATAKPLINALKQLAADGKLDGRLLERRRAGEPPLLPPPLPSPRATAVPDAGVSHGQQG
ncbi:DUF4145 domain-containing protein [Streptomyces mirabilis]|uniref:DUF4145 domain-containing protein n=1 Tax=Streptomyces mirabilis TaxID=68239 RepID=UPI00332B2FE5